MTLEAYVDPVKQVLRPLYQRARRLEAWAEYRLGRRQSERAIEKAAQRFWDTPDRQLHQHAHWRGAGIFEDEVRWLAWGEQHLRLYRQLARVVGAPESMGRIIDWGCGGGANAIHFARLARQYVGVEITAANLDECARQLSAAGMQDFVPVLIRTEAPEEARALVPGPCDLFLCLGVFQVLPTPEYGLRVLEIARDLLRDGGLAFVQIKYPTDAWTSQSKRFGYRRNFPNLTSYAIPEFWTRAERIGLIPKAVSLVPRHPVNRDGDYAYFLLKKPGSRAGDS